MAATKGLGTYGNGVGTVTPLDHKMAQLGLVAKTGANTVRAGVFWDGNPTVVSGTANMSYNVRAFSAVTSRGATSGAVLLTNDGTYNVVTTAAPGSNSRYDVVYIWQREYSIDGTDSNPVIGVVQGTAAASPSVPSLASFPGAIELARILVPAGVTATNSGTTITQRAPFTATAGGVIPFRNTSERDEGTFTEGQLGWLMDSDSVIVYTGSSWRLTSGLVPLIPTSASGGAVGSGGTVTFSGASSISINGVFSSAFDRYLILGDFTQSAAATAALRLRASGTDASAANTYDRTTLVGSAGAATSSSASSTGFDVLSALPNAAEFDIEITLKNPGTAVRTLINVESNAYNITTNTSLVGLFKGAHRTATAYDGFSIIPSSGTLSGKLRIYGYSNN